MTTKLRVAVGGTGHVFPAFSSTHPQWGHVITLMFWERTGGWANGEEMTVDAGGRTFWDKDEAACLAQLHEFVRETWQTTATVQRA